MQALPLTMNILKIKIPLKIKVYMWLLYIGVILTKNNLVRMNWHGGIKCCFYNISESIQHLSFDCTLSQFIWCIIHLSFNIQSRVDF